jgi:hypothetical protein
VKALAGATIPRAQYRSARTVLGGTGGTYGPGLPELVHGLDEGGDVLAGSEVQVVRR